MITLPAGLKELVATQALTSLRSEGLRYSMGS